MGFFNQQYADQLNMEETATEYLMRNFNLPYQDSRKCLGRFGLESHAHTIQISKLSGRSTSCLLSSGLTLTLLSPKSPQADWGPVGVRVGLHLCCPRV